ncbi:MAG: PEP/pyruvate-binding domain-containing protein, partial [Solirubrobacterales bacterium]
MSIDSDPSASAAAHSAEVCREFAALRASDTAWAGGKGANLGELTSIGMPVPPGFVIGATAFAGFCDETGLRARLAQLLAGVDVEDDDALRDAADAARAAIDATAVPDSIARAIEQSYARLRGGEDAMPVAVRSSATAEDTAAASFAGMHDTFLNVHGLEALVRAVRNCWSSLYSPRTIYYRARQGMNDAGMDIAVVVQRQLVAKRSGVMFTIDPATGRDDTLVIEASFGLGEAVVSGSVSPDHYVIDKRGPALAEREVRRKEMVIEALPSGGTERRELGELEGLRAAITDDEAIELARLGLRIEEHYGRPQDIEWVFDNAGAAWIVQSRPVTVAAPSAEAEA